MKTFKIIQLATYLMLFLSSISAQEDFSSEIYQEGGINTFASADLNDDGKIDLVGIDYKFVGESDLIIMINTSTETEISFESSTIWSSEDFSGSPGVGDIDDDGDVDIVVSIGNDIMLMNNTGDLLFEGVDLLIGGVNQLKILDLEGDGDMDIIGHVFNEENVISYINDGSGHFIQGSITAHQNEIADVDYGDIDDDGDIDFVLAIEKFSGETVAIYTNDSTNTFSKFTSADINALNNAIQVDMIDFNKDGRMDIVGINDKKFTAFYQSEIFGFVPQDLISPSGIGDLSQFTVGDFVGNGAYDVIMGDFDGPLNWYKNLGVTFDKKEISGVSPVYRLLTEDFDNDGDADFAVSNGDFRIYKNEIDQVSSTIEWPELPNTIVSPNPATSIVKVALAEDTPFQVQIIDAYGRTVLSKSISNEKTIQVQDLESGTYFLQVVNPSSGVYSIGKFLKI